MNRTRIYRRPHTVGVTDMVGAAVPTKATGGIIHLDYATWYARIAGSNHPSASTPAEHGPMSDPSAPR